MQTERVTFLTSPDHKAALDAFAMRNGKSVGHVLREASSRYIAENDGADDSEIEAELDALTNELEAAIPGMQASLEDMERSIAEARVAIRDALNQSSSRR